MCLKISRRNIICIPIIRRSPWRYLLKALLLLYQDSGASNFTPISNLEAMEKTLELGTRQVIAQKSMRNRLKTKLSVQIAQTNFSLLNLAIQTNKIGFART